jgi:hypothetical protein
VDGLRYYEQGIAVIERPPTCRTIFIREVVRIGSENSRYKDEHFRLAFPWQVYSLCYTTNHLLTIHLAFRNTSMTQKDQTLCYPSLWNVYTGDLRLCLGDSNVVRQAKENEEEFWARAIGVLWGGLWTCAGSLDRDYQTKNAYANDRHIGSYSGPNWSKWAKTTADDPSFITSVKWPVWGELDALLHGLRTYLKQNTAR